MESSDPSIRLLRIGTAVLCVTVAFIHVQDQGGFPGDKTPGYVGVGYWLLEAAGVICALLLLAGAVGRWWRPTLLLAAGVGLGPVLGYVLSRGPGLPDYSDDKGNWTEPLGLVSLAVETLLMLAIVALTVRGSRRTATREARAKEPANASAGI